MKKKLITIVGTLMLGTLVFPLVAKATGGNGFIQVPSIDVRSNLFEGIKTKLSEDGESNLAKDLEYVYNRYGVIPLEYMDKVTYVGSDWVEPYLNGLEHAENLERLMGEFIDELQDFTPIKNSRKLKEILVTYGNNTNLKDLRNLENLEKLTIGSRGVSDRESWPEKMDMLALYDLSDLSELTNLKRIKIDTAGLLQTITLKKGTKTYEMYSPVIKSSQFKDSVVKYYGDDEEVTFTEKDSLLRWENIDNDTEFLLLTWDTSVGENYHFSGDTKIPINWID
ncbi:hypothetical protein ACWOC1_06720 [Enterococcus quebecensis]|uniref:Uncharacterized protein n=1 Tax=Enterococcus quebecensis TaxID=903983 RepID=A0A1E5GRV8_9ENTE|nr:hypothetical protein [Enterococcus quebecensis]OEG15453.1 hypothetical protein BCR23_08265 [Enterococcus quebecensis]OJG74049.1 hypothetical protein RV12_GL000397 [Enterococcus quebecensis]